MIDMILEPYSVRQRWRFQASAAVVEEAIGAYAVAIARDCAATGTCVVGHIKALALFRHGNFYKVNVVGPDLPYDRDGAIPAACTELALTLNVIAYGIESARIAKIVQEAADRLGFEIRGAVTITTV